MVKTNRKACLTFSKACITLQEMNKPLLPWPANTRRYVVEFSLAMIGYVVVLVSSLTLLQTMAPGWLRVLVAIAPVLPLAGMFIAFYRYYSGMDELWRRIWLEAVALAGGATTLIM